MNLKQYILLVATTLCFVTISFSQHGSVPITNGIGIQGGITQFDIITDNFETAKSNGWLVGMSATVDIPHKWYNVSYNIQFSQNNLGILGRPTSTSAAIEELEYKMLNVQVALLIHIKLIENYLTIDAGPMLQYGSELELINDKKEDFYVNNYVNLKAKDISKISQFNFNGAIGVSAGVSHFRLKAQYIYGLTNTFNKLNKQTLDVGTNTEKFKGNQSMLALTAMITF
jgi:hypothetical protein